MRVIGIDPGVWEFAWAIYDPKTNEVEEWGLDSVEVHGMGSKCLRLARQDDVQVCIEDIAFLWGTGKETADTLKTIGWLMAHLPQAVMITRQTIRAALTGTVKSTDADVNRALGRRIPSFAAKRKGLDGHHRAAAACAYVGVGHVNKEAKR